MAIKELTRKTLGKTKAGWIWDKKRELFFTWQVDTRICSERKVERGFRSEQDAKEYLEELKDKEKLIELGVVKPMKFPTVKALFDRHLKTIKNRKSQTAADRVFKKFLSIVPAGIMLDKLRRKHFKDFCETRVKEGIKEESAAREITDISSAIHKAGDYFESLENWTIPSKLIYRPEISDEGRDRVVTKDEREKLIRYLLREREPSERSRDYLARRRTGLIVFFAALTGLRHGEISALRKSNFDREANRLQAERFKTRKKGISTTVFEPLTKTQLWVLDEAAALYPESEFFFSAKGKIHNRNYDVLEAACKKLEIPYGANTPGGFVVHDLRHTFVTILEQGSIDSSTTRSFSGHTKDSMLKRYAHATPQSRANAMKVIEREVSLNGNGDGNTAADNGELKRIFGAVRSKKMTFEDFKKELEFVYRFFAKS